MHCLANVFPGCLFWPRVLGDGGGTRPREGSARATMWEAPAFGVEGLVLKLGAEGSGFLRELSCTGVPRP